MSAVDQKYKALMRRRVKLIAEIKQCKIDAESWNDNYRKADEAPIETKWCDDLLQQAIESLPQKPKAEKR